MHVSISGSRHLYIKAWLTTRFGLRQSTYLCRFCHFVFHVCMENVYVFSAGFFSQLYRRTTSWGGNVLLCTAVAPVVVGACTYVRGEKGTCKAFRFVNACICIRGSF